MSESFSVGEVAILRWSSTWPQYPQSECTVTGALRPFRKSHWPNGSFDLKGFFSLQYEVRDEAGEMWICSPRMLRKKTTAAGLGEALQPRQPSAVRGGAPWLTRLTNSKATHSR